MTAQRQPERPVVTYPDNAILNVEELAAYLRIQKDHAYELVHQGEIPSVRLGRQFRIPMWGVLQWLARQSGAPYSLAPERQVNMGH